jgi:hypothetical protein
MTTKQAALALIQSLPENTTTEEILTLLHTRLQPVSEQEWSSEDVTEEEWMAFVAQGLEAELSDPREDIYDLQDEVNGHEDR